MMAEEVSNALMEVYELMRPSLSVLFELECRSDGGIVKGVTQIAERRVAITNR